MPATAEKVAAPVAAKKKRPERFGPSLPGSYPPEMRRQMWPLCCGASIISGFKSVNTLTEAELLADILSTINDTVPDLQIFAGEQMKPAFTFLTLNSAQMASTKIMTAIKEAGFVRIGTGRPRGGDQGFFLRDTSKTWKAA